MKSFQERENGEIGGVERANFEFEKEFWQWPVQTSFAFFSGNR